MEIFLLCRHALMVEDGAFSHTFWEIPNLEGHPNCITGSRVTAILLNEWIVPIGQSGEACRWRAVINGAYPLYLL